MKRAIVAGILALTAIVVASEAFALSFSVDVPVQFTYAESFLDAHKNTKPKDSSVTDTNGFILGVSAGWLGVGYEQYEVNAAVKFQPGQGPTGVSSAGFTSTYQLYDVFLDLPLPLLHAVIGYGQGRVSTNLDPVQGSKIQIRETGVSQSFVRLGIPVGPLLDLHLGYHAVKAEDAEAPNAQPTPNKLKLSGNLLTLGARLGW